MNNLINDKVNFFSYLRPKKNSSKPFIITSPHSGVLLNKDLLNKRNKNIYDYDSMQDMYVNSFSEGLEKLGFTVFQSHISRIVIDLNREITEIDPKTIVGFPANNMINLSDKVKSGIGLIPMKNSSGRNIYTTKLDWQEVWQRIDNYYLPWHNNLRLEIDDFTKRYGRVFVIDMHSMPSETNNNELADFVIGNNFDRASDNHSKKLLSNTIKSYGYSVAHNNPYSGGFITRNYSSLKNNIQCIQIEIKKSLYMDENNFVKNKNFEKFKLDIKNILNEFYFKLESRGNRKVAAE